MTQARRVGAKRSVANLTLTGKHLQKHPVVRTSSASVGGGGGGGGGAILTGSHSILYSASTSSCTVHAHPMFGMRVHAGLWLQNCGLNTIRGYTCCRRPATNVSTSVLIRALQRAHVAAAAPRVHPGHKLAARVDVLPFERAGVAVQIGKDPLRLLAVRVGH